MDIRGVARARGRSGEISGGTWGGAGAGGGCLPGALAGDGAGPGRDREGRSGVSADRRGPASPSGWLHAGGYASSAAADAFPPALSSAFDFVGGGACRRRLGATGVVRTRA